MTTFGGCIDDEVPAIRGSKNFLVIIVIRAFVLGLTKEWMKVVSPCYIFRVGETAFDNFFLSSNTGSIIG